MKTFRRQSHIGARVDLCERRNGLRLGSGGAAISCASRPLGGAAPAATLITPK